jgi:CDGSH-type Zn-finger protein
MSRNQPFCDNSHLRRGWRSGPENPPASPPPPPREGAVEKPTRVVPLQDGSLELRGHIRLHDSSGEPLCETGRVFLCRCGNSGHKPFCDTTHERVGFKSRDPELPRDRLEAETPAAFTPNPRVPDPREAADDSDES